MLPSRTGSCAALRRASLSATVLLVAALAGCGSDDGPRAIARPSMELVAADRTSLALPPGRKAVVPIAVVRVVKGAQVSEVGFTPAARSAAGLALPDGRLPGVRLDS